MTVSLNKLYTYTPIYIYIYIYIYGLKPSNYQKTVWIYINKYIYLHIYKYIYICKYTYSPEKTFKLPENSVYIYIHIQIIYIKLYI